MELEFQYYPHAMLHWLQCWYPYMKYVSIHSTHGEQYSYLPPWMCSLYIYIAVSSIPTRLFKMLLPLYMFVANVSFFLCALYKQSDECVVYHKWLACLSLSCNRDRVNACQHVCGSTVSYPINIINYVFFSNIGCCSLSTATHKHFNLSR